MIPRYDGVEVNSVIFLGFFPVVSVALAKSSVGHRFAERINCAYIRSGADH